MAGETVEALIGCCTRDITALEQLYIRMKKPVMALAVGILQDFHLAEDALQETFVRLPAAAPTFRANARGEAFILAIARNVSKELRRKHKDTLRYGELPEDLSDPGGILSETVRLRELLSPLSAGQREIVILHTYTGLSLKEIAGLQRLPASTVRSRYAKALKLLRETEGLLCP